MTALSPAAAAAALIRDLSAVSVPDTPSLRAVRRGCTREWRDRPASFILEVARLLARGGRYGWIGFELVRFHHGAFSALTEALLADFAEGLDSWDKVDSFGRTLSGPAWAQGLAADGLFEQWARSPDRWLRRLALVSTIELRDADKVLAFCDRLAADRDDMVEKALSWALRELAKRDPEAVRAFLAAQKRRLGARVRREVGNKLRTGLKNPRMWDPARTPRPGEAGAARIGLHA